MTTEWLILLTFGAFLVTAAIAVRGLNSEDEDDYNNERGVQEDFDSSRISHEGEDGAGATGRSTGRTQS